MKGLKPSDFPFLHFHEFCSAFVDDIEIHSGKDLPNATDVHLLCIEATFFALEKAGWLVKLEVSTFMNPKFVFLGIFLGPRSTKQHGAKRPSGLHPQPQIPAQPPRARVKINHVAILSVPLTADEADKHPALPHNKNGKICLDHRRSSWKPSLFDGITN